ncbi:MAG: fused response regulator/phosphatase [Alphaproteobacteria bacterium]|nr:fused response regulator/phosphatase [Alphaproteobacteria bacterium]
MIDKFPSSSQKIPAEFQRAHVVIVDDDATNRLLLREVCEKLGIGIIDEADDGDSALDLITRFRPDLILLDIRMPRMDGYELMRRLRANPMFDGLPVLVQTCLQGEDERVRCFNFGATDVVSRPFHLSELMARIRAHLRSAIASRVLFDFRNRIQAHIEITHAFLNAVLPNADQAAELAACYGLDCSSVYRPHDEIGGDLWSLRALDDDHIGIVLVDASAHGLAGAINALRVDCLVQEYHEHLCDPGVFLNKLDAAMAKISFGQLFAGAVALTFHRTSGLIRFAGTNIPSPLLRCGETITDLKTRGLPLGSGMVGLTTATAQMPQGASLILFSDGWLDGTTADPVNALRQSDPADPELAAALAPEEPLADDLTLIALRRR